MPTQPVLINDALQADFEDRHEHRQFVGQARQRYAVLASKSLSTENPLSTGARKELDALSDYLICVPCTLGDTIEEFARNRTMEIELETFWDET